MFGYGGFDATHHELVRYKPGAFASQVVSITTSAAVESGALGTKGSWFRLWASVPVHIRYLPQGTGAASTTHEALPANTWSLPFQCCSTADTIGAKRVAETSSSGALYVCQIIDGHRA